MIPEGALGTPAPPVPQREAVRLACELFDIGPQSSVRAVPLPGEYDHNFEIDAGPRGRFVLKVMHPAREVALVELQCEALKHVEKRAPGLRVSRLQMTRDARAFVRAQVASEDGGNHPRLVWMLAFIDGTPLALVRPQTEQMLVDLGRYLGALDCALADFRHPAAERDFKWDLTRALWIEEPLRDIPDSDQRRLIERALAVFRPQMKHLSGLRRSVIHSDANDYNVLVAQGADGSPRTVSSVIDFGDMHLGVTVAEVAIAAAYSLLGREDPMAAAMSVVRGYHQAHPLDEGEIRLLFPLILARLAVSVTNSAMRRAVQPDDPYVTISEAPALKALERLLRIPEELAHARFRHACGLAAIPRQAALLAWIRDQKDSFSPILDWDLRTTPSRVFDLSVGSALLGADPGATETATLTRTLFGEMERAGVPVGVGRYDEARLLYVSPLFGRGEGPLDERRTIHLGVDLFAEPGARVRAPLDGEVHIVANNQTPQDYGPLIVLKHRTGTGDEFFTLFGHLSESALALREGQQVRAGEEIARIGAPPGNGDWAPHVHFQIIFDLLGLGRDYPGVCRASERAFWTEVSPDPNLMLGIPQASFGDASPSTEHLLARRHARIGGNVRLSYRRPLRIVRGFGCFLYDETGRAYLDMYNNVPLVGHSHPRVVGAVQNQIGLLNTNTRYLHDLMVRYAERLTALLPDTLSVCYFVNSGTEANDLALRMARTHTGRADLIVLDNAYHGHTQALIDASPYKFLGRGGQGQPAFVHIAPMPDDYRGPFKRDDPSAGVKYGGAVGEVVSRLKKSGCPPAAFIAETYPSVGGQIVPPPGYLTEAYRHVRDCSGLCIADEVQVGFGRLGSHFWGFEAQGVVPDIVVLGKPMGNGFPIGAVVTTETVARSFDNGMEFFSTFGGNPVACAAGLAVLDVVRDEGLQERAFETGNRLMGLLKDLMARHRLIGDVRGSGLFIGVELVTDRATRAPAASQAAYVVNRLRDLGVLAGTDGPHENVIKLRPPLTLRSSEAELFVNVLDAVLGEDDVRND